MDENSQEHWYTPLRSISRNSAMPSGKKADVLIPELESALIELRKIPKTRNRPGRIFRALHTIKGSGRVCEFHDISAFTHDLETVLDNIKSGQMACDSGNHHADPCGL